MSKAVSRRSDVWILELPVNFAIAVALLLIVGCGGNDTSLDPSTESAPLTAATAEKHAEVVMAEAASSTGDGSSSKLLRAPTEQFGTLEITPPREKPAAKNPELVTISTSAVLPLKMNPTSGGDDKIISTLSGEAKIEKVEPELSTNGFHLAGAQDAQVVSPDLGACKLVAKNFDQTGGGKIVAFTLMGLDDKTQPTPDGCLVKLSTMAFAGFTVEFKNVRLGGSLSETFVPRLRLQVAPAKAEQQN